MKKAIITGTHGAVAPVVAEYFKNKGYGIVPFDRSKVDISDFNQLESFIVSTESELLLHFAMGSEQWAADMAKICCENNIKFLFTSTVDVLSDLKSGPYTTATKPYAESDYGKYKIRCEELIRRNNPNAYIVRLGWQIGSSAGSNNMVDFLTNQMRENGVIRASKKWYPSCSFITDTARGIYYLLNSEKPDTYLLNSNLGYSFYQIVSMLCKLHPEFKLEEDNSLIRDDRMLDDRVKCIQKFG